MPNIKLTEQELEQIIRRKRLDYGSEASIYETNNPHTLYKIFQNLGEKNEVNRNKEKKLKRLYKLNLEHCVQPVNTLSMNGELIGYEMTYDQDDLRFIPRLLKQDELIYYLEQTKKILEYFATHDITYGDVASRNILINRKTGQVKFCDMDNIRLGSSPIDLKSFYLDKFAAVRKIDASADAYMHSIMTLDSLEIGLAHYNPLYSEFFEPESEETLNGLHEPENFNGEYLIQYIKKKR